MLIEKKIKHEIEIMANKPIPDLDYNIFQKGFLDSLNVLHIILFIESEFNITINPYDVTIDMFDTINKIVDFVKKKSL